MWLSPLNMNFHDDDDDDDDDDDVVDPRVQEELERLNNATDAINKLEVELDESRAAFRQLLCESTQKINSLANKLGSCVEKARPYYEARMREKLLHSEAQKTALRFERANSAHAASKEMVFLAEEGLQKEGRTFDPVWQEMLNHATKKVNEAERERLISEQEHKRISKTYTEAERRVQDLKKELKKSIMKSSPYFDMKAQFNKLMEEQKNCVETLEENVLKSKQSYADALHNLEVISDEIHQRRKMKEQRRALGTRGTGVGAEHPEPIQQLENCTDEQLSQSENNLGVRTNISLGLPKSLSSSTLSEINSALKRFSMPLPGETYFDTMKLKKSQSVVGRTQAAHLFGCYSISKNYKLQVDCGSQTDDVSTGRLSTGFLSSRATNFLISLPKSVTDDKEKLNIPREKDYSTPSSRSISVQSSENSSPTAVINSVFLSKTPYAVVPEDESATSDAESLASIDCLTDDQIACLMLDKELEDVAESLHLKATIPDCLDEHYNIHQMTQTSDMSCQHAPATDTKIIVCNSSDTRI